MDLVTVVCIRDYNQMLLQAESIQKFLAPCRHWVIVNDEVPDVAFWQNGLSKYYTNHELVVIPYTDLFENTNNYIGHYTQQVCKLMIVKLIKDDYLILDAKNFFVKPTNTNEWDDILGSGRVEFLELPPVEEFNYPHLIKLADIWKMTVAIYKEVLHLELPDFFLSPLTPFKIQADVLLNYEDLDLLYDLLSTWKYERELRTNIGPSEFIFYSFLCKDLIQLHKNVTLIAIENKYHTCWHLPDIDFDINFPQKEIDDNKNIKVLGLHHKFLNTCSTEQINRINDWLSKMSFTFKY
jgi:hypothetical protein